MLCCDFINQKKAGLVSFILLRILNYIDLLSTCKNRCIKIGMQVVKMCIFLHFYLHCILWYNVKKNLFVLPVGNDHLHMLLLINYIIVLLKNKLVKLIYII